MGGWAGQTEDFTGTAINAFPSETDNAGLSLSLVNQTGNNSYIQFNFSMTGLTGLDISYATQKTSTGFNSDQWSYSTDGINFNSLGDPVVPPSSYALVSLSTSALDGAATAYFRTP